MEALVCKLCELKFDTVKYLPIALPCGHTVCKPCLTEIYIKLAYIKCPIDNTKHFQNIENYNENYLLMNFLKSRRKITQIKITNNKQKDTLNETSTIFIYNLLVVNKLYNFKSVRQENFSIFDSEYAEKLNNLNENEKNLMNELDLVTTKNSYHKNSPDTVLFSFFDILIKFIKFGDKYSSVSFFKYISHLDKFFKFILFTLLACIIQLAIFYKVFLRFFTFIILMNESNKSIKDKSFNKLTLCLKRW